MEHRMRLASVVEPRYDSTPAPPRQRCRSALRASLAIGTMFSLDKQPHPAGFLVVYPRGPLDGQTYTQFETAMQGLAHQGEHAIIVDLRDVDEMTSVGAGCLIGAVEETASAGGCVLLANASRAVGEVFDILGLKTVPIPDSLLDPTQPEGGNAHAMAVCLAEAMRAAGEDEVPVGACVVKGGSVIARDHNRREAENDPTAHAELLALRQAAAGIQSWRLEGCRVYVSLEPCPMCAGALLQARVPEVTYAAADPKAGAMGSLFELHIDARLNHRIQVDAGQYAETFGAILGEFFGRKRAEGKK